MAYIKTALVLAVITLLATTAGAQTKHAPLAEQAKCAAQAKKFYLESDFPNTKHTTKNEFTSHYDAANLICYVRVNVTTLENDEVAVGSYVFDAFENRTFASYTWISVKGKKFREVKPMECSVRPLNGKKIICESTEEFENLVDKHFGLGE
jgi:hypothetical protein